MNQENVNPSIRAGFFAGVAQAEAAVRNLFAAGFTKEQIAIIVPEKFRYEFDPDVPEAEVPGTGVAGAIAAGGVVGATLGGLALVAVTLATAGAALLPAATVLVGGGAIAGGFSGLIVADGYNKGVGEYYEQAIQLGKIVVGVHIEGEHSEWQLEHAARILEASGAEFVSPTVPSAVG